MKNIRNFCIIAHIDHGKSTLADRLLEYTKTVEGKDIAGNKVSDMGDDYYFPSAAIKVQATDKISLGLIYDQPYGADATYVTENSIFAEKSKKPRNTCRS